MNEWFQDDLQGRPYTAEAIATQLDAIAEDEASIDDSVMWYPVFAMEILERSGAIQEVRS